MRRITMRLYLLLATVFCVTCAAPANAASNGTITGDTNLPEIAAAGARVVITSSSSLHSLAARETAGPDTFALYGGPDHPTQGKFQMANGSAPDWGGGNGLPGGVYGGGPDAWTPVDLTYEPVYWHIDTFNAEALNNNGPGNRAMWSGLDATDPLTATWANRPGYGNDWSDGLLYESAPVVDPSVGQTVTLEFFFHHDTEPDWDYFEVQYETGWATTWSTVLTVSGSNKDVGSVFQAPGVQFSAVQTAPIIFNGNDYTGKNRDQIRIRLLVSSDGARSDEDGLWPTNAGAVQIDDISLTTSLGTFTEDFEGPGPPYLFNPDRTPFAGDFADVYSVLTDIDPCRQNNSPVIGFIDYNQVVRNGPAVDGVTLQTGGSISPNVDYGIPGNWVVNYTDGLPGGWGLRNEIWSPEIAWDLPGSDDDDVEIAGAFIRFSVWDHLPLINGIFWVWHVRSATAGNGFGEWGDRAFVHYADGIPLWLNRRQDVSDLLVTGPERVQVALGVWDLSHVFGFPGVAATPSPVFDNVAFYKYRVGGPSIVTQVRYTAQDGFPITGSIDVGTQTSRDALDIPFSMARDINSGDLFNDPGDSVIVDVVSVVPGAVVTDIRMVWALSTNAVFEDAIRSAPARSRDENVVAGIAGTIWTGEVVAGISTTSSGLVIPDRFFVDLPDIDFMYPGDVLHYYIEGTDSDARVSTLPGDTSGFGTFGPGATYDRAFTVRCLPTMTDTAGAQPPILVWNDFGRRGGEDEWANAFQQLGYNEGVDFDTYTTQSPGFGASNGLGSSGAHGAAPDQLAGYHHMFYFAGNLTALLLSNGTNAGANDKGDDIGVLEQWHALAGVRNVAYFGDFIGYALTRDSAEALGYLTDTMGVDFGDKDVRDVIGGQTAPLVTPKDSGPYAGSFATQYVAYGGCALREFDQRPEAFQRIVTLRTFDQFQPLPGADAGHYFTDPSGIAITDPSAGVASVINPTANGVSITFPHSLSAAYEPVARTAVRPSVRALLFQEILGLFNAGAGTSPVVPAPEIRKVELSVFPNPFNPVTTVKFTATMGTKGSVKVYNVRGELVRTLHDGEFQTQIFSWDGTDNRGASVASGVYLIKADANRQVRTLKTTLMK